MLKQIAPTEVHPIEGFCRRPSQKVKVLKLVVDGTPGGAARCRRPSQKVKVLKHHGVNRPVYKDVESQTFSEGKGVETGLIDIDLLRSNQVADLPRR